MTGHDQCHETVDAETRDEMLTEYGHTCETCGRAGPGAGGIATLHVHHRTRNPEDMELHDPANLTVLCRLCHSWYHQQPTENEMPIKITDEDMTVLLPKDIEILQTLVESGPLTTGGVSTELSLDLTITTVRERLWVLMGLASVVESRDQHVVDQDVDTGEWGLPGQIERSARGLIPTDPQTLLQRFEDELVRRALNRGCDRTEVMSVLNLSRRSTFHKEKRGRAFDFPLDAIDRRGGRPQATQKGDDQADPGDAGTSTPRMADSND